MKGQRFLCPRQGNAHDGILCVQAAFDLQAIVKAELIGLNRKRK